MSGQLDLLLVNPGAMAQVYGSLGSNLAGIEPPTWGAMVAAYLREQGFNVAILDAEAENLSPEATAERVIAGAPRLTCIIVLGSNPSASSTPKMTAAGEVAAAVKRKAPGQPVAYIGLHTSALPERTLREEAGDYVCQGEGFFTLADMLRAIRAGQRPEDAEIAGLWYRRDGDIIGAPHAPLIDPDDIPAAAWDLLPMERYRAHNWHCFDHIDKRQPYAAVYTSLGCPYDCHYCNISALYNGKPGIRYRSARRVEEEIGTLVDDYGVHNLKIIDELFAIKEDRVDEICDIIISRGWDLNIWAYARVDSVTEPMLKKMKRAGINWLAYGIESGSGKVRKGVTKRFGEDTISRAVRLTQEAGIYIIGNYIFGLPEDDTETMQETLRMAEEYNTEYINFYTCMAYPGSRLYEEALQAGTALPEHWYGYSQYSAETLPLPTSHLTAAQVLRFRDEAFHHYFGQPRYLEMLEDKFGPAVVAHVQEMSKGHIKRKYA